MRHHTFPSLLMIVCILLVLAPSAGGTGRISTDRQIGLQEALSDAHALPTTSTARPFRSCTLKIRMTLENGTKVKGTITVSEVTWWQCKKLQVANFFSKIF